MHERVLSGRKSSFPSLLCFKTPGCDSHYSKLKVVNLLKYAEVSGCPLRPGEFTCAQSCTVNTPMSAGTAPGGASSPPDVPLSPNAFSVPTVQQKSPVKYPESQQQRSGGAACSSV